MPDQRTVELIHYRIDGVIEESDRIELEKRLASDPGARQLADELDAMNSLLAETPLVEPPAGLVTSVMAKVRGAAADVPLPFVGRRTEPERRRSLALRFAFGLAAVLAIGFLFVPSLRETIDPHHVKGTMIGQPDARSTSTEIPIRGERLAGLIRVTVAEGRVRVVIEFDAAADRQLHVRFDPSVLSPREGAGPAVATTGSTDAAVRDFELSRATTSLEFSRMAGQASSIELSVRQGEDVFETTIDIE